MIVELLVVTLTAVGCGPAEEARPPVDRPEAVEDHSEASTPAEEVRVMEERTHATFGVVAKLPAGWAAEAGTYAFIPADTWTLRPDNGSDTEIRLLLAWQPRGGRHSSSFPGGMGPPEVAATFAVGGVMREGWLREDGRAFRADFDVGELAVSLKVVGTPEDWPTLRAVLSELRFDEHVRPDGFPSPARRALDLARRWSREQGEPAAGIVYTGQVPGSDVYAFTVFGERALTPLRIDPANGSVDAVPP